MMSALKVGGGGCDDLIKIKSATSKGYEEAHEGDSINFSVPSSETRRGRVGKGVAQTLDTSCNQGTMDGFRIRRLTPRECFLLMDFPDTFTWKVSDSQAYKQAGNSIVVNVLYKILKQLPL
jgi:DNA (cytosine-5)-methyltransferase 1